MVGTDKREYPGMVCHGGFFFTKQPDPRAQVGENGGLWGTQRGHGLRAEDEKQESAHQNRVGLVQKTEDNNITKKQTNNKIKPKFIQSGILQWWFLIS